MNRVCLSGRLTATPEFKMTKNHVPVTSFSLAVRRPMSRDETDFINCVAWNGTAEFICSHFIKGKWIEIEGVLTQRSWVDRNGKKQTVYEVECTTVGFGDGKKDVEPLYPEADKPQEVAAPEEEFAEFFNDAEFLE